MMSTVPDNSSFKSRMEVQPEIALMVLPVVVKRFRETNERLLAVSKL